LGGIAKDEKTVSEKSRKLKCAFFMPANKSAGLDSSQVDQAKDLGRLLSSANPFENIRAPKLFDARKFPVATLTSAH